MYLEMRTLGMVLLRATTGHSNHLQQSAKDYQSLEVGWRLASTRYKEDQR
jgi:hypothetical protein